MSIAEKGLFFNSLDDAVVQDKDTDGNEAIVEETEADNKNEEVAEKDETDADLKYYLDVTTRCTEKMLDVY